MSDTVEKILAKQSITLQEQVLVPPPSVYELPVMRHGDEIWNTVRATFYGNLFKIPVKGVRNVYRLRSKDGVIKLKLNNTY